MSRMVSKPDIPLLLMRGWGWSAERWMDYCHKFCYSLYVLFVARIFRQYFVVYITVLWIGNILHLNSVAKILISLNKRNKSCFFCRLVHFPQCFYDTQTPSLGILITVTVSFLFHH